MDITAAYLHGEIDADIYMRQPPGHVDRDHPTWLCKLNKGLYGLKQAGRLWHAVMRNCILDMGFDPCANDPCLFKQFTNNRCICIIALYVDDLLIAGDIQVIDQTKRSIASIFAQPMRAKQHRSSDFTSPRTPNNDITIDQTAYIDKLLTDLDMTDCNSARVPVSGGDVNDPGNSTPLTNITTFVTL